MDAALEVDALALSVSIGHLCDPIFRQETEMISGAPRARLTNLPEPKQSLRVRFRQLAKFKLELFVSNFRSGPGREFGCENLADGLPTAIGHLAGINNPSSMGLVMRGLMISSDAEDSSERATTVSSYFRWCANSQSVFS